ncbi:MAG: ubiquinone/menaquinone biosynthesis C-methyltransferase UbiE [marine bacterium B5-7]|nr:MAG: ubiquinone/menaquinone biosynthesis C-methyltransferase UbiE [marine bacterium B5-7]
MWARFPKQTLDAMMPSQNDFTDFGYEKVSKKEKTRRVADVFHSVASKYDVMNDLMSFGVHRLWKRAAITLSAVRSGHHVLDLAGGTGDLSKQFAKKVGDSGRVVLSDINASMLQEGRDRLLNEGLHGNITFSQINAEHIPFPDNHFNCVSIGFGLRNVTDKQQALNEMYRVVKPGGRLLILEFSKPVLPGLKPIYDFYSFKALPLMGKLICNDAESYRYLAESIRMHPDQETLLDMMKKAGFEKAEYHNLSGGIVALHLGHK